MLLCQGWRVQPSPDAMCEAGSLVTLMASLLFCPFVLYCATMAQKTRNG